MTRLFERALAGMTRIRFAIVALLALGLVGGSLGFTTLGHLRAPTRTAVLRGEALASEMGCFTCHGAGGRGGIANPGSPTGEIPPLASHAAATFYVNHPGELREWIELGRPRRQSAPARGHVVMPAYGARLSSAQVDDLVAYLTSLGDYLRPTGLAAEGRAIAERMGCFGCHGEGGRGGPSNPGSFKGYVPPWHGDDFALLVESEAELREWILDGITRRFAANPGARFFLDRQAIKMPAYRELLSDRQVDALVAYVGWLRDPREAVGWQERWLDPQASRPRTRVEAGRELYLRSGCADCHGAGGEGGALNPGAAGKTVPRLDDLAEKLELFEKPTIAAVLAALEAGQPLDRPETALAIEDPEGFRTLYRQVVALILEGGASAASEPGLTPAMPMPAFAFRNHAGLPGGERADVDSILAYLISLYRPE